MGDGVEEDRISIVIEADGSKAESGIDDVMAKLRDLDAKVGGSGRALDGLGGDLASKLSPAVTAIEGLSKSSGALDGLEEKLSGIARGMSALSDVAPDVARDAGERVSDLASGIGTLENVDAGRLNALAGALDKIPAALRDMDGASVDGSLASKLDAIASASERASKAGSGMASLAQGLKGIPIGLDAFANIDGYDAKVANFGTVLRSLADAMSSFDAEARANASAVRNLGDGMSRLSALGADSDALSSNLDGAAHALSGFSSAMSGATSGAESMRLLSASVRSLVNSMADLPAALSGISSVDGYESKMESLSRVVDDLQYALSSMDRESRSDMSALSNLAQGLGRLSELGADADRVGRSLQALVPALSEFASGMANSVTPEELQSFSQLADALDRVTQAYEHMDQAKRASGSSVADAPAAAPADGGEAQQAAAALQFLQQLGGVSGEVSGAISGVASKVSGLAASFSAMGAEGGGVVAVLGLIANGAQAAGQAAMRIGQLAVQGFQLASRAAQAYLSELWRIAQVPIDNIRAGIDNVTHSMSRLASMAASAVFYNSLFGILRTSIDGVTEGVQNLYQWALITGDGFAGSMDSCATSLQYFKNSIGAAASGLLDALAPALETIINYAVAALNAINQLISALTGHTTWRRARRAQTQFAQAATGAGDATVDAGNAVDNAASAANDYTRSTNRATKAAKAYQNTVLGFDELNKLNDVSDTDTGGGGYTPRAGRVPRVSSPRAGRGGGTTATPDYGSMFEEVPIDQKFKDLAKTDDWTQLGKDIADALNNWEKNIDWDAIDKTAAKWSKRIWTAFNGFVRERDWSSFGYTIARGLNVGLHFIDDIAQNARFDEFGAGIAGALNKAVDTIDWPALGRVMTDGLKVSLEILHGFMNGAEGNDTYAAFNFDNLRDHLNEAIDAAFDNIDWQTALTDLTNFFGQVGLTIVSGFNEIAKKIDEQVQTIDWTGWGSQVADYLNQAVQKIDWPTIGRLLSDGLKVAFEALHGFLQTFDWEGFRKGVNDGIDAAFDNIDWKQAIQDLATGLGEVATSLLSFGGTVLENLSEALGQVDWGDLGRQLADWINKTVSGVDWEGVGKAIMEFFKNALKFLWEALSNVDWGQLALDLLNCIKGMLEDVDWMQVISTGAYWVGYAIGAVIEGIPTKIVEIIMTTDWGQVVQTIVNVLQDIMNAVLVGLAELMRGFFDGTNDVAEENLGDIENNVDQWFADRLNDVGTFFTNVWQSVSDFFTGLPGNVADAVSGFVQSIGQWFTDRKSDVEGFFSDVGQKVGDFLSGLPQTVADGISGFVQSIGQWFQDRKDELQGFFDSLDSDYILKWITNLPQTIANGIATLVQGIQQWFTDRKTELQGFFDSVNSEYIMAWLANLPQTLADGVAQLVASIQQWFTDRKTDLDNFFAEVGQKVTDWFANLPQTVTDGVAQLVENIKQWFTDRLSDLDGFLGNVTQKLWDFFTGTEADAKEAGDQAGSNFADGTASNEQKAGDAGKRVADAVKTVLEAAAGGALGIGGTLVANLASGIINGKGKSDDSADKVGNGAKDKITEVASKSGDWGRDLSRGFAAGIEALRSNAGSAAQMVSEAAKSPLVSISAMASSWGSDLASKFASGLRAGIGWVASAADAIASAARSRLHFSVPDEGPLSDFDTYAPDMMRLYAKGIRDNARLVTDSLDLVTGEMADAMSAPLADAGDLRRQAQATIASAVTLGVVGSQPVSQTQQATSSDRPIELVLRIGNEDIARAAYRGLDSLSSRGVIVPDFV